MLNSSRKSLPRDALQKEGIAMKHRWIFLLLILMLIVPSFSSSQTRDPNRIYKVAILPFVIYSRENLDYLREGIYDILSSRITVENKIVVIDRSVVDRILYQERPMRLDEPVAREIGRKAGADYIVLGSLTKVGDYISLDARLVSITEDKPTLTAYTQHKGMDDVMVKIGEFAQDIGTKILGRPVTTMRGTEPRSSTIVEYGQTGRLRREDRDYKKSQTFSFEIRGLDIGDVDGDKKNEVVIMDKGSLYIFKFDGEKLALLQKVEAGYEYNFLTLDVADVNRNGYAEMIVTGVVNDNLRSLILEMEEGKIKKIVEESGWFYRVLEHPKDGLLLMGQKMGPEGVYTGAIYRMDWKKNGYERGPKLPFPSETWVFGLTLGHFRNSKDLDLLTLDELCNLTLVAPDGKKIWTSRDTFGETNTFYQTWKKKDIDYGAKGGPVWRVYIPARILRRDFDGDGLDEVIIPKNEGSLDFIARVRSFDKGEIYNLIWEENRLVTNWRTREIPGYIADYQIRDVDNDGEEDLIVGLVNPGGTFERGYTSNIFFYKLF